MSDPSPPGPKAPRQRRSEETLRRILDGAMGLLARHDLDEIGVDQIAAASGVSVGVIYTRFKSKDDLLAFLLRERQIRQVAELRERLAPQHWGGVGLADLPLPEQEGEQVILALEAGVDDADRNP
jgi:AcrR family transcriptional regulator